MKGTSDIATIATTATTARATVRSCAPSPIHGFSTVVLAASSPLLPTSP
jgi:hypothetical protein